MVYCEAIVEDTRLKNNLVQCIKILGGEPSVKDSIVTVRTDKNEDKVIDLFEQFSNHHVHIKRLG